jgi:Holliday junction resolvase RusA-like endonuclease
MKLTVPGTPVPLERARVGHGRHYLPAKSVDYRERIRTAWTQSGRPDLGDAPLTVSAQFYLSRPASHWGTGRNAQTLRPTAIGAIPGGDIDNYIKATLDALNALAYRDDKQIICLSGCHKMWADPDGPRTVVELWTARPQ